jgi:thymidylate synthase
MSVMTLSDYKIQVFKEIMLVENEMVLKQLHQMVHSFLADYKKISDDGAENGKISFEEWNEQFIDNRNLDDFIPEYGITLREFR